MNGWNYLYGGLIGGLLGTAELISRYRDRPSRVLLQLAAWSYVLVNAAASLAALLLIDRFKWDFGQTGSALAATQVLVAGLGAAVLFRSSLFVFKVGDENVGMGPSLVLSSLLGAADRSVDRAQATARLKVVSQTMPGVDFAKAQDALVAACLAASANVSAEDANKLRQSVQALSASGASPASKSVTLGLLLIDTVGAEVLKAAVIALGNEIK
jgi:hypothetical protein